MFKKGLLYIRKYAKPFGFKRFLNPFNSLGKEYAIFHNVQTTWEMELRTGSVNTKFQV
jgi:hypothetical protein